MGAKGFLITYRPVYAPVRGTADAFMRAETEIEARTKWAKQRTEKIVRIKPFYAIFAKD